MAQVLFEMSDEKKHALKVHCATQGVTMRAALTGAVDRLLDGRVGDEFAAENYRLAALTGAMATEVEVLTRERDELRDRLDGVIGTMPA